MDLERLLVLANSGKVLAVKDREKIAKQLHELSAQAVDDPTKLDDLYSIIVLVRRAGLREFTRELENCLDLKDALVVGLALETLCLDWSRADDYLERVLSFAVGVAWDEEEDIRHSAIKILGEFLRSKVALPGRGSPLNDRERHVLSFLFFAFREKAAECWTRRAAYRALCRVAGREGDQVPHEYEQFSVDAGSIDIDWEMIRSLEKLVG